MDENLLIEKLLGLAACTISPGEWLSWWKENEAYLQTLLSKGDYLRIKPCKHDLIWLPMVTSQKGACRYLESKNIPFDKSGIYQSSYETELDSYCKRQDKHQKLKIEQLKTNYPQIFCEYPKFANSLKRVFSQGDSIKNGVAAEEINQYEKMLDIKFPHDIQHFFNCISSISLDAINIDIERLYTVLLHGTTYCVLGEFWQEADGDLLLFLNGESTIYYYAHEQDKIKPLCANMSELLEKKFASYNKEK